MESPIQECRAPAESAFLLRERGEPALSIYRAPAAGPAVLYVHGATFPAALSIAYRIGGRSWADDLQERAFDVWSFDLAGYGGSDRAAPDEASLVRRDAVAGRAPDVAHQIARVVAHIRERTGHRRIAIIAHSWGSIPAALFAGAHPETLSRLVLFGPVAQREGGPVGSATIPSSRLVSAADQWRSFQAGVPQGEASPIDREIFDAWADLYLASDPQSGRRIPPCAQVPAGPEIDFEEAWSGRLPYDPSLIRVPALIVRGEWDTITTDADAEWLINAMTNVPGGARDVKLPRGAHRMHLEANRQALFDAVGAFLTEE
jgi:pimeloyl-ACP methyl ester carboxylesterase